MNREKIQIRPEEKKENESTQKKESKRFSGKITVRKLERGYDSETLRATK